MHHGCKEHHSGELHQDALEHHGGKVHHGGGEGLLEVGGDEGAGGQVDLQHYGHQGGQTFRVSTGFHGNVRPSSSEVTRGQAAE